MKKTKPVSSEPQSTDSPYMTARREWNERYGDFIAAAYHWRLAAFASFAISLLLGGGLIWISGQHKVVPYAVQFDGNGEIVRVARADIASQPAQRQIIAALRNWVIGARTVYVDTRAQKAIIDQTYATTYPSSAAFQALATHHREHNPYERAQSETVEIAVNAIVPISAETWQVEWTETTRQRSGRVVETKQWQGTITIVLTPPTNEAQILVNPLGIYVRQFAWTPRI